MYESDGTVLNIIQAKICPAEKARAVRATLAGMKIQAFRIFFEKFFFAFLLSTGKKLIIKIVTRIVMQIAVTVAFSGMISE